MPANIAALPFRQNAAKPCCRVDEQFLFPEIKGRTELPLNAACTLACLEYAAETGFKKLPVNENLTDGDHRHGSGCEGEDMRLSRITHQERLEKEEVKL
jgi:hypothetical protein